MKLPLNSVITSTLSLLLKGRSSPGRPVNGVITKRLKLIILGLVIIVALVFAPEQLSDIVETIVEVMQEEEQAAPLIERSL